MVYEPTGKPRGFATMTPEQKREITSKGGKRAHALGVAHKFKRGSQEARDAGRKGGTISKRGGTRVKRSA